MAAILLVGFGCTWCLTGASADDVPDDGVSIPCALPSDAVKAVPAPFDTYMQLACTHAGQALKPVDGALWVFPGDKPMWLLSASVAKRDLAPETHFTKLTVAPLSAEQLAAFRAELHKVSDKAVLFESETLRLEEETSGGARRQIYLLIPPKEVGGHILGIECINDCIPMEDPPWAFVVIPRSELNP